MLTRSQPSGKLGPSLHAVGPLAILGALVLGFAYQFLINIAPTVKIAFIIVAFGALGAGAVSSLGVRFGKCRNVTVAAALGLLCAGAAIGASHFCEYWLSGALNKGASLQDYLRFRTSTGWKIGSGSTGGPDITGGFVYLMWLIEAGAFIGASVYIGMDKARDPFCDTCDLWAQKSLSEVYIDSPGPAGIEVLRKATTIGALVDPPALGPGARGPTGKDRVLYSLTGCPSCGGTCTLTLKHVAVTRAGKREQAQTKVLHKHIALTTEEAALVKELIEPETAGKSAGAQKAA